MSIEATIIPAIRVPDNPRRVGTESPVCVGSPHGPTVMSATSATLRWSGFTPPERIDPMDLLGNGINVLVVGVVGLLLAWLGKGQFQALKASFEARFDAIDQRFEAVDRWFEAVDRRFEAVETRIDRLEERVE